MKRKKLNQNLFLDTKSLEADAEKATLTLRKEFDEKEQEYLRVLWHKEVDTIFNLTHTVSLISHGRTITWLR